MNEKMPCGILSERDLDAYGEYLKSFDKRDENAARNRGISEKANR